MFFLSFIYFNWLNLLILDRKWVQYIKEDLEKNISLYLKTGIADPGGYDPKPENPPSTGSLPFTQKNLQVTNSWIFLSFPTCFVVDAHVKKIQICSFPPLKALLGYPVQK